MYLKNNDSGYVYEGSEDVLINPEDAKNIYIIENFISEKDLKTFNNFIKRIGFTENANPVEFPLALLRFDKSKTIIRLIYSYRKKIKALLEEKFDCIVEKAEFNQINRYLAGDHLNEHADKVCESWRDLSSIIYYADDYEGGEFFFSQYGIEFTPKAGTLVYFPAGANYAHGVRMVTSGERYTTTVFWKVKKWNSIQYS
jgi:hypothetical protein